LDRGRRARNQAQQAVPGRNGQRTDENRAEDPIQPPQGHGLILLGPMADRYGSGSAGTSMVVIRHRELNPTCTV
jgi:hypothetical protein